MALCLTKLLDLDDSASVLELLLELGATDEQLDSPMLYCSGRSGTASLDPDVPGTDFIPLFDKIVNTSPLPRVKRTVNFSFSFPLSTTTNT